MSTILAIETSTELASVALLRDERVVRREISGVNTHSQTVLPMVQAVLKEAGIALSQCDAIAFGSGPGSFTGVRTACGAAQGLAFGADLAVVPVVTLEAMAQACREEIQALDVLVTLDARMGGVYWAQYAYRNDAWQTISAPRLSSPSAVEVQGEAVACGNGLAAYPEAFEPLRVNAKYPHIMPHASHVAALARIAYEAGQTIAARDAQPLYVRDKVALTTEERQARAAS